MPLYQYKARGRRGDAIEGSMEAVSSDAVASQLIEGGMTPVEITVQEAKKKGRGLTQEIDLHAWFPEKVSDEHLIQFSRQMHSLTKAGVPLLSALHGLSQSTKNKTLAQTIRDVAMSLEGGHDFATSLSEHPQIFNMFYVSMIRIGETSGQLDQIFTQLAYYLDRDKRTRNQIKSALRYPTFVTIAIGIAIVIINLFVIPTFASIFSKYGAELPLATRILLATSRYTVEYWLEMLVAFVTTFFAIRYYFATDDGHYFWDKHKLKIPLVGNIIYRATLARFTRLFAISMAAGVPLIVALQVVSRTLDNRYMEERLLGMQTGIERGETITRTAMATGMFDGLVMQMMSVGEETGAIDSLMAEVASFYEAEVENDIDKLSAAIEPILTVVIAGIVLVLAWGVFLPLWNLADVAIK